MNNKTIVLAALLAACAPAWADEPAESPADGKIEKNVTIQQYRTAGGDHTSMTINGVPAPMPPGAMHFESMQFDNMGSLMHGKQVKNAPYSAEVISERVQNLADGNQIVNKTSAMYYRDSAGRTRQEMRDNKGDVRHIMIFDPSDNVTYSLNPKDKKAIKIPLRIDVQTARLAGEKAREKVQARLEQLKKDGKVTVTETNDGNGNVIIKRIERNDGDGSQARVMENVHVRVAQAGTPGQHMELARVAPLVANAFNDGKWSSKAAPKALGTKEFDGVKAEGKLRSYEIPAGEVGNKNPITVSSESWFSPELQITVYSKQSDPRSGDRIYRVANLKRDEPAASLFAVPSDYTVRETPATMRTMVEKIEKTEKK